MFDILEGVYFRYNIKLKIEKKSNLLSDIGMKIYTYTSETYFHLSYIGMKICTYTSETYFHLSDIGMKICILTRQRLI